MPSIVIYLIGALFIVGGGVLAATQLGIPVEWIVAGSLVVFGSSVMAGVRATRGKRPSPEH